MKQLCFSAIVLFFAVLIMCGCLPGIQVSGPSGPDRHYDAPGPVPPDAPGPGQPDGTGPGPGPVGPVNQGPAGGPGGAHNGGDGPGQPENHGHEQPGNRSVIGNDAGEQAIKAYVKTHTVPIKITRIEPLTAPVAPGTATQTLLRYKVSAKSTGWPTVEVVRIVDYHPGTGTLALER